MATEDTAMATEDTAMATGDLHTSSLLVVVLSEPTLLPELHWRMEASTESKTARTPAVSMAQVTWTKKFFLPAECCSNLRFMKSVASALSLEPETQGAATDSQSCNIVTTLSQSDNIVTTLQPIGHRHHPSVSRTSSPTFSQSDNIVTTLHPIRHRHHPSVNRTSSPTFSQSDNIVTTLQSIGYRHQLSSNQTSSPTFRQSDNIVNNIQPIGHRHQLSASRTTASTNLQPIGHRHQLSANQTSSLPFSRSDKSNSCRSTFISYFPTSSPSQGAESLSIPNYTFT